MNMRALGKTKPPGKSVLPPVRSNLLLQRRATDREPLAAIPPIVHDVLNSPGQPLDPDTRAFMEPRFGHDFRSVRVHTDAKAAESARAVHARAYTVGHNVVFGENKYVPTAHAGHELLAHELTHVIQVEAATSNPKWPSTPVEILEREAHQVASAFRFGAAIPSVSGVARHPFVPLRQPDDSGKPTFGNLPQDVPDPIGVRKRVVLVEEGGVWYEMKPNGQKFRAQGSYDFVVQRGKISAVKGSRVMSALNPGHTEAAAGGRVEYAGQVKFGSSKTGRGTVVEWSNASGHYTPVGERKFAEAAGLPMDKFKPLTGETPPMGPQLPAYQLKAGEILEPRGRGGDVKKLGAPKQPVPQKTVITGEITVPESGPVTPSGGTPKPQSPIESPFPGSGMPEPVPEPKPSIGARVKGAFSPKNIRAGLRAAVSAENIASMIPDVVLGAADRVAAREASRAIGIKFTKEGFAKGVAAGVTGWSKEEVRLNLKNRVTPYRVERMGDPAGFLTLSYILQLAEANENQAVDFGYQFSSSKTLEWKKDMIAKGLEVLAKSNYYVGRDPEVLFESDFIDRLAWALHPITDRIVEERIQKAEERKKAELLRKMKRQMGW
jgi:hypothetical protein